MPLDLDLSSGVVALTAQLVDVPSESGDERVLADAVETTLAGVPHLAVERIGNNIVARTALGRAERVVIGGHLDTVPSTGNLPHRIEGDRLYGLGSCDMKGSVAIALLLAVSVATPRRDVTYVFYECEEVDATRNGLGRLARERPDLLAGDLAILMEPSDGGIEAGCQGTLRAEVRLTGRRAHSARAWMGDNAIHAAAPVLQALAAYEPRRPVVEGLEYHEGMSAVGIRGGVAGNVIPDECVVTVNHRFAPDRTVDEAVAHVRAVFDGYDVAIVDSAPAARPGLDRPAAADFVRVVGVAPRPKFGWTDVARFAGLGVPALNFGPGDPSLAHHADENVPLAQLTACEAVLRTWLAQP